MFEYKLSYHALGEKGFELRFSPILRIVLGFFALALLILILAYEGVGPVGYGLFILSILSLGFEDRWIWNRIEGHLEHRFGLVFWFKKRLFPRTSFDQIILKRFFRGPRPEPGKDKSPFTRAWISLAIDTAEQGPLTIEAHKEGYHDDLAIFALELARAHGTTLREEQD